MKWINARFPDDLHAEIADAANAEERPIGSWLRIAAKEKLARDSKRVDMRWRDGEWPTDPSLDFDEAKREVTPRLKNGGK